MPACSGTAHLDTGSFPTAPLADPGTATTANILDVEARRLADYVVGAWEIDPALSQQAQPTITIRNRGDIAAVISKSADLPANKDLLYGFASARHDSAPRADDQVSAVTMVLRFLSPAAATAAGYQYYRARLTERAAPQTISGLAATLAVTAPYGGRHTSVETFTARGAYLLYSWVAAPRSGGLTQLSRRFVIEQGTRIDGFRARPTKQERHNVPLPMPQLDPNRVLRYTIPVPPATADSPGGGAFNGVFGRRGITHFAPSPSRVLAATTAAGVDDVAFGDTMVYRASSVDKAARLRAQLANIYIADGFTLVDNLAGLPSSTTCVGSDSGSASYLVCILDVGRYVATIIDNGPRGPIVQKTAAQYVMLSQAPQ